jgi:hypothetical protein
MKLLPILTTLLIALVLSPDVVAQKQAKAIDSLFNDFDLFTLKGIRSVPANNPDSIPMLVRYARSASGTPKSLDVIDYDYKKPFSRNGTIQQTPLGTIIGFKTLKTPGWEKVLFIGQKYYYYDSILIRHDTIFFKSLYDERVKLQAFLPVKNDTLIIREVYKSYRGPYLEPRDDPWINLANYKEWFKSNNSDRAETYTLVRTGDHYELTMIKTDQKHISEYDYKSRQERYRKMGVSSFWIAIDDLSWP